MSLDEIAFDTIPGKQKLLGHEDGLTKRELFAAMAMQGLLAGLYSNKVMLTEFCQDRRTGADAVSDVACCYADALIVELAKERK